MLKENNKVKLIGTIASKLTFSHEIFGEGFYLTYVSTKRLSEHNDVIPAMISERLIDVSESYMGNAIEITGHFRSHNYYDGVKRKLLLFVFAQEIRFIEEHENYTENDQIALDGYICKTPIYRRTPMGREITDLLLAVNRPCGKTDYIPCIAWGRNARFASGFKPGERIQAQGRIQSREYKKQISECECEIRTAYEVSIQKLTRGDDACGEL